MLTFQFLYQLAKDYVERLKAALKGFCTFERSAHSRVLEEPQKPGESPTRMCWPEPIALLTVLAGEAAPVTVITRRRRGDAGPLSAWIG